MSLAFNVLLSAIVLTVGAFRTPDHARCPRGWWLAEGIRRSGSFVCRPPVIGGDDDVLTGLQTSIQPPEAIAGQIYCSPPKVPITLYDFATVTCR